MKSKKIVAILMALSIVGSTSFVLGGTAKAATLNGTSSTVLSELSTIQQESIGRNMELNVTSDGTATWDKGGGYQNGGFAKSRYYLTSEEDGGYPIFVSTTINTSASIPQSLSDLNILSIKPGIYTFSVINYNPSGVAYAKQSIKLIYDGSTYSTVGLNLTLSKDGAINWNSVNGADYYRSYVHTQFYNKYDGSIGVEAISGRNTDANITSFTSLKPGIYYVTVDAYDSSEDILASETLKFYYTSNTFIPMNNKLLNK